MASVDGWDVHVNHLHGGKLIEHGTRRKPRRQRPQSIAESDVQAIGEKGDENVRLNARLELVMDRADGEIAFQIFKCLFDSDELQIICKS